MRPLERRALLITSLIHVCLGLLITLVLQQTPSVETIRHTQTTSWQPEPVTQPPQAPPVAQKQKKATPKPVASVADPTPSEPVIATESIPVDPQPFETDRRQPEVKTAVSPVYPKIALINNWEGQVRVALRIGINGRIKTLEVVQSSGFPELDAAYINSLNQQQYLPQEFRGEAIEGLLEQAYTFSLDE